MNCFIPDAPIVHVLVDNKGSITAVRTNIHPSLVLRVSVVEHQAEEPKHTIQDNALTEALSLPFDVSDNASDADPAP